MTPHDDAAVSGAQEAHGTSSAFVEDHRLWGYDPCIDCPEVPLGWTMELTWLLSGNQTWQRKTAINGGL